MSLAKPLSIAVLLQPWQRMPPKDVRNTSYMIDIQTITFSSGAISVTPTSKTALRIKLVAEANAAEMGLALSVSEIPS